MKNNLFTYATSELSQDAFLCWLFSYAMKYAKKDDGLRKCAVAFLKEFIPKLADLPDNEIWVTKITRQYAKIDVLLEVNNSHYIIIEDKTFTSDHDNQLVRYKDQLLSDGIPENEIFCVYFKIGFEASSYSAVSAGYTVFDRKRILNILRANKEDITNDIFCDYYDFIEAFEADVQRYKTVPVSDWDWKAILGYYDELINDNFFSTGVMDGEFSYGYIPNKSGGFYGAWLFQGQPVGNHGLSFYPYIQVEFKEGSVNICARLSVEKFGESFTATKLKDCIAYNNTTEWIYNLEQFGFYRPRRLAPGTTMTVGKVWQNDRSDIGYKELTEALQRAVNSFENFISYCRDKVTQDLRSE